MPTPTPNEKPNGEANKLATLASIASSGDNWVKLATLVLIALSGIGNFFATRTTGDTVKEGTIREVHALYLQLDDFQTRQMRILENQRNVIESNNQQLQSQSKVLSNQENFLRLFKEERDNEFADIRQNVSGVKQKLDRLLADLEKRNPGSEQDLNQGPELERH